MGSIIKAEHLKFKRTFGKILPVIAPTITLLLVLALTGGLADAFPAGAWNWWYATLLPGTLAVMCYLSVTKDRKNRYYNLKSLPVSGRKLVLGKMIYLALGLFAANVIIFLGATIGGAIFGSTIPVGGAASVFLIVQKIRQGRRRPTKMGDMGMFSGLLYCADCGGKMYLCRTNHFKPEQEYYICSTYRKDRTLCTTHSIRRVVLEEIVLRNLREAIQYVTQYEDDFVQRAADQSLREREKELAQKKDTLTQSQKRIAELDVIIKRLYEDNISGKLSDERFIKLSRDYELEQTNLTNLVEHLRQEVKEQEKQKVNVRQFIAAVRKYTDMQQLDASVLREFVEKIYISEVYTPDENEPRIKVREIEIVYNFIGAFDFEEAREQSQAAQKEKKTGVA